MDFHKGDKVAYSFKDYDSGRLRTTWGTVLQRASFPSYKEYFIEWEAESPQRAGELKVTCSTIRQPGEGKLLPDNRAVQKELRRLNAAFQRIAAKILS